VGRHEESKVATTFAELVARVHGVESRTQRADEDITALITSVVEIREDVSWTKKALAALTDDVAGLSGNVAGLSGNVAGLSGDVAVLKGDTAVLKGDMAGLSGDVAVLKGDVAGLKGGMRWTTRALDALLAAQGVSVAPDRDDEPAL
jgi:prophage DNA circulation protein